MLHNEILYKDWGEPLALKINFSRDEVSRKYKMD